MNLEHLAMRIPVPLWRDNPVTVQMLGLCSALAVTTTLANALTLSVALTAVMCCASVIISAIRRQVPDAVRLVVQITIIASLVIVVDLLLQAWLPEMSQRLSIFVSLIVTNCLVLGRAEAFAMHQPVLASLRDALWHGLGYSLVLMLIAFVRELLGEGTLFGHTVLRSRADGGWFEPLSFMSGAPSAFILLGLLVWISEAASTGRRS